MHPQRNPSPPQAPRGSLAGSPPVRPGRLIWGWANLRAPSPYSDTHSFYSDSSYSSLWAWAWGWGRGSEAPGAPAVRLGLGHQRQKLFSVRPRSLGGGKGPRGAPFHLGQLPAFLLALALGVLLAYLAFVTSGTSHAAGASLLSQEAKVRDVTGTQAGQERGQVTGVRAGEAPAQEVPQPQEQEQQPQSEPQAQTQNAIQAQQNQEQQQQHPQDAQNQSTVQAVQTQGKPREQHSHWLPVQLQPRELPRLQQEQQQQPQEQQVQLQQQKQQQQEQQQQQSSSEPLTQPQRENPQTVPQSQGQADPQPQPRPENPQTELQAQGQGQDHAQRDPQPQPQPENTETEPQAQVQGQGQAQRDPQPQPQPENTETVSQVQGQGQGQAQRDPQPQLQPENTETVSQAQGQGQGQAQRDPETQPQVEPLPESSPLRRRQAPGPAQVQVQPIAVPLLHQASTQAGTQAGIQAGRAQELPNGATEGLLGGPLGSAGLPGANGLPGKKKGRTVAFQIPVHLLSPGVRHWRRHLHTVLLVLPLDIGSGVSHSHPGPRVAFLRQLYGRVFPRMLLTGLRDIPQLGVQKAVSPISGESDDPADGRLSYAVLQRVENCKEANPPQQPSSPADGPKGPSQEGGPLEGVLYMSQDVVLNYWNLAAADKSRVWFNHGTMSAVWEKVPLPEVNLEDPAPADTGSDEAQRMLVARAVKRFPEWARENLLANGGSLEQAFRGIVPIFYTPRAHLANLALLAGQLADAGVHADYALPLLVSSLCKFSEVDPVLDSFKVEGDGSRGQLWYTPRAAGGRPWNYSDRDSRMELLDLMLQGDGSLTRMKRRHEKYGMQIENMFKRRD